MRKWPACLCSLLCLLLLPADVQAQFTGPAVGGFVWVGGAVSGGFESRGVWPGAAGGLQVEHERGRYIGLARWERFAIISIDCKGARAIPPFSCGDAGMALSMSALRVFAARDNRRLAVGPQLLLVDWDDTGTSIGFGVGGRAELRVGAGSIAFEPFVRTAVAHYRLVYGGAAFVLLLRPWQVQ